MNRNFLVVCLLLCNTTFAGSYKDSLYQSYVANYKQEYAPNGNFMKSVVSTLLKTTAHTNKEIAMGFIQLFCS